jgi:hypothetical protein
MEGLKLGGEKNLELLLRSLSAELVEGCHVFVTVRDGAVPDTISPRMMFREAEGMTLLLMKSDAEELALEYEYPCRMITLNVHSPLHAVGFIARVATELAREGISVNPVSAFFHDHLFVPDGRESDAMNILERIASGELK